MIFEVTPSHIDELNDSDLRTLVGYLAESEVTKVGRSPSAVTYGGHQNAKDGGIDVRVSLTDGRIEGYVPRLATGFQAKAEEFAAADIKKEMRPKGRLRESIVALAEAGGAYIIVSSKGSVSDLSLKNRIKAMADALSDTPAAPRLLVDFYDKRRIASWVNQHPGIVPWVRERVGQPISGWRPFQDWSSSPAGDGASYVLDDGVRLSSARQNDEGENAEDGINRIRTIIREPRGNVRLVGLSGVGKTRMVQALFDDQIGTLPLDRHLAIYGDIGDNLVPGPAELLGKVQSSGQRCILVVDNCGSDLHRRLTARLSANSKVSLITVEYDISDDEPENTDVFRLIPASKEVIEKILKPRYSKLTDPEIRTIADFSEGNFRIALALAGTAKDGQSLANLKDVDLFSRLFRQKNDDDPALLRAAKVCSLVYSFDMETITGDEAELPLLASLAGQSVSDFHAHLAELQRRQVLQARSRWRALLPQALAHRLAKIALEDIPASDIQAFTNVACERMLRSFSRRIGCLHDHVPAQKLVRDWLSAGGLLADVGHLNQLGMTVLKNIAPVDPEAALKCIETAAASQDDFFGTLSQAGDLVGLLRSLAYEPSLFANSTRLVARFARSKTESNNLGDAVNVFKSLFYIALSGTHAPAKARADFVRRLAGEGIEEDQALVLVALDAMLKCTPFSSCYGFEFGTRKRDYGFHVKTWDEQFDWYSQVFLLARDLTAFEGLRGHVRSRIASQFQFLATRVRLDDLIGLAERFVDDGGWPEGWVGVRNALHKVRKAEGGTVSAEKLAMLEQKLAPRSLTDRISSYVLPKRWSTLDLADVDVGDTKRYEEKQKAIEAVCDGIGAELASNVDQLRDHLPQLLQSTSERVNSVARATGRTAIDPDTAWEIIEHAVFALNDADKIRRFPGEFLGGLAELDRAKSSQLLDAAALNPRWHPFLPHMQLCVGLDPDGCKRLIGIISATSLPAWTLHALSFGRSTEDLPGADFKELVAAIAKKDDGLDAAIEILYMRLFSLRSDMKPVTIVEREVAASILEQVKFDEKKNREPHRLAEIVRDCLADPDDGPLARRMCKRLSAAIDAYNVSIYDYNELVGEIARIFPRILLEEALEPEIVEGGPSRGLVSIFREDQPSALCNITDDVLLQWAREKPETRFEAIAAVMIGWSEPLAEPNAKERLGGDDVVGLEWTPTAQLLIRESPDPIAVLAAYARQFKPSAWSGSLANILSGRRPLLNSLTGDSDCRIADWAKAAIPRLEEDMERATRWEANRDRERDERFDW